ncbi:MAG: SAM-dependent DNA methyltransferase [Sedimentisphaerales bacterium]|nr:SAM-dependent DNA methyltransferase [Sedimentisphaerales bacterium]
MYPTGTGPRVIADLARRKIGTAIERQHARVDVGILATDPNSNRTEDPLAIVCDFDRPTNDDVLKETHRLTWSFSRSPMLVTVEPNLLRVWTCWRRPQEELPKLKVEELRTGLFDSSPLSERVARSLQWVELTSGSFFRNPHYSRYFHRDQRADQLMLNDLRVLRERLLHAKPELPEDICHDLLARVIFIEFLFQRKDSQGNAALNEDVLSNLHEKGVLSKPYKDLVSILRSHTDTYGFFRELNSRFNGDLFPGKGQTDEMREREWAAEMCHVKQDPHLRLLAEFVSGKMEMTTGQFCLWRRYAFDAIPLEFISSIYEEFVTRKKEVENDVEGQVLEDAATGAHYTPSHLVDLVLDEVLPWDGSEWDVRVLDPACGSGIFLVKAFQRMVERWKKARGKLSVADLRHLLKNNLFGVDKERNAVRVASFSLYLAMCDEIEPKFIWQKNVSFPRLRDKNLVRSDFFGEDRDGFCTTRDQGTYHCVVGNAPWGYATETGKSKEWAALWGWNTPNRNIGPLFLCKAARLAKPNGKIAMLQPAGAMLFNRDSTAMAFRQKLFSTCGVEKIVNLSLLRFGLFRNAVSPACMIVMRPGDPLQTPIVYECPKPKRTREDEYSLVVEPSDGSFVEPEEAATDPFVWTVLAWGGPRDLQLIRKLRQRPYSTIAELEKKGRLRGGNGFKRGIRRARSRPESLRLPILEDHDFWHRLPMAADTRGFPRNINPMFERIRDIDENYTLPLLIMKESWTVEAKRFRAAVVEPEGFGADKLLFSQSFNGIRSVGTNGYDVHTIALAVNSTLAVYYFLLSSARMGNYRPALLLDDLREFPLPASVKMSPAESMAMTESAIDDRVKAMYRLNDAEWVLIEDMFLYTLRDFKEGMDSPGRQPTRAKADMREETGSERVLREYYEYFARVFRAGFGSEMKLSATIFDEAMSAPLPVRLMAIHLDPPGEPFVRLETIDSANLVRRLTELNAKFLESNDPRNGGIFYQRVARIYDAIPISGTQVPTVFLLKPDQVRYWTRSAALRDADEIARDIMLWREASEGK